MKSAGWTGFSRARKDSDSNMKCLIIKATSSACNNELDSIRIALKTHRVETRDIEWLSQNDFLAQMGEPSKEKYDLVYLAAHADMYGFGESGGFSLHTWDELANAICMSSCMLPGATLFLGCCRGGMKTVALAILRGCDQINYICGPVWTTKGTKLIQAFNSFAECKFAENVEPDVIKQRMSNAAGQQFSCYDRQELESEVAMLRQIRTMQREVEAVRLFQETISGQIAALHADLFKLLPAETPNSQTTPEPHSPI